MGNWNLMILVGVAPHKAYWKYFPCDKHITWSVLRWWVEYTSLHYYMERHDSISHQIMCYYIQKVIGSYLSPSRALCYAPTFYGNGKVKFKLLLDGTEVEKQDTYYLACKLYYFSFLKRHSPVNHLRTVFSLPRVYVPWLWLPDLYFTRN